MCWFVWHWIHSSERKMENPHWRCYYWRYWLARRLNLWALKKCILVRISTKYRRYQKNSPESECNWPPGFLSSFSSNGLDHLKPRSRTYWSKWDRLQKMFISSTTIYWTNNRSLHKLEPVTKPLPYIYVRLRRRRSMAVQKHPFT